MQNTIAIICDCDETLAPDTTVFLLDQNNVNQKSFWKKATNMVEAGWDPPLAYMTMIVELMKAGKIKQDTNKKLSELGRAVRPYDGVPDFITELKTSIKENRDFADAGVNLESYIISSGIEDLIKGSNMGRHFTAFLPAGLQKTPRPAKLLP